MYKKIITALAISVLCPLAALAQYDGAPMQKPSEKKEKAKVNVRRDKYPHSDNDWENFDVLHINRLPSAAHFMGYPSKDMAVNGDRTKSPYFIERHLEIPLCTSL